MPQDKIAPLSLHDAQFKQHTGLPVSDHGCVGSPRPEISPIGNIVGIEMAINMRIESKAVVFILNIKQIDR